MRITRLGPSWGRGHGQGEVAHCAILAQQLLHYAMRPKAFGPQGWGGTGNAENVAAEDVEKDERRDYAQGWKSIVSQHYQRHQTCVIILLALFGWWAPEARCIQRQTTWLAGPSARVPGVRHEDSMCDGRGQQVS